jgi:formyl-CoA transferase/CoA:oxalate CoA-transferase
MLADLGADIIKVRPPHIGDIPRGWGPPLVRPNISAYFYSINRNKRSAVIDFKTKLGKRTLEALL